VGRCLVYFVRLVEVGRRRDLMYFFLHFCIRCTKKISMSTRLDGLEKMTKDRQRDLDFSNRSSTTMIKCLSIVHFVKGKKTTGRLDGEVVFFCEEQIVLKDQRRRSFEEHSIPIQLSRHYWSGLGCRL
jgi:hypothetical protein